MGFALTGLNILVVEDDALLGMLLAELLETMGHRVCAIEATEDGAVRAAAACLPDLMILDGRLASGSGVGAARQICATRATAYIFVSGDSANIISTDRDAVTIEKPYGERALASAIDRAMAQHEAWVAARSGR
jgi:two-component system, response regulator PdtaR